MPEPSRKMIDSWFPCAAVDEACGTPAGSGRSEKAIFTWFASRPIAQARAAVLTALLPPDEEHKKRVTEAVKSGSESAVTAASAAVRAHYGDSAPIVVDIFSGRGVIPLEAARFGARAVGIDLSPVATLAGRVLADYPLRKWDEPDLPFRPRSGETRFVGELDEPKLLRDTRTLLHEVGDRTAQAVEHLYPRNDHGAFPWGYLWAVTMPCDGCDRRFPLVGSLTLRHPQNAIRDPGQAFHIVVDDGQWAVEVFDGPPSQSPTYSSATSRKGKSARCPFCKFVHGLDTVKAKGFAGEYEDVPLVVADLIQISAPSRSNLIKSVERKSFRPLRRDELEAALAADPATLEPFDRLSAVPNELIPAGNVHSIQGSGYGYKTFGSLMVARQAVQFSETVRAIRDCHLEMVKAGLSEDYAKALTSYAASTLVRRIKNATRGSALRPHGNASGTRNNRVQTDHIFSNESKVAFNFDCWETGPGEGPGTWQSVAETGLTPLRRHLQGLPADAVPARLKVGSAMSLPYRDQSVDAVITDPPYYDMIEYADASDLFFVWLKRALFDIEPDLFGGDGLQNKDDEIIVRRVHAGGVRHDRQFYEDSLSQAFAEARRVLRASGQLVVVFGHSDPDAWKRLLGALHDAGFVVTSSWPSRTEAANTGVASIKVTVTIGCHVAPPSREPATADQVDRQVIDAVTAETAGWTRDGLALSDQMMASYGPAMEVYGRHSEVIRPDGSEVPIQHYLDLARNTVRAAAKLKVDEIPLETFDDVTRFAVFWLREHGRTVLPKG